MKRQAKQAKSVRESTSTAATSAVAALLVTGVMMGAALAAPGSGLGVRTTSAVTSTGSGTGSPVGSITLITGDRVRLDAENQVIGVQHAPGREGVPVSVRRSGDDSYVLPSDAAALIGQGALDKRLFNVSGLVRAGYDDARRGTLPLIVSYQGKAAKKRDAAKTALSAADVTVRRELPSVGGAALSVRKADADSAWQALTATVGTGHARTAAPGIARVWLDGRFKGQARPKAGAKDVSHNVTQIGAPTAWDAGYDGKGVKVAVVDSGIDSTHPDLEKAVTEAKDFSGTGSTDDRSGHGTHVAATVAGSGARSGGLYKGVAPGAEILNAKVLNDSGEGTDSSVIAGLEWAADQGAKVANLSLGQSDTPGQDPVETAVNSLSEHKGLLTVASAGNDGPKAGTISTPGSADSALTVGAVDGEDGIAGFSSTGPTADSTLKPDLTAPGVDIVSAKAAHGDMGDPAADGYVAMSGTSMAAPHVTGAAAILAQEHPDWTGQRIKQALTASTKPTAGLDAYQQGTGRVDVARGIAQSVVGEQTSVSFGKQMWPHTDDQPVTKRITYRNHGEKPVTLDLSATATGPEGKAAPDGLFSLSARQLTVPAGGTASVDLTADTRTEGPDGAYSGTLVATAQGGDTEVRTSFGVIREAEAYDVTLKFLDRQGKPVSSPLTEIKGYTTDYWTTALEDYQETSKGVYKLRIPRGDYVVDTVMSEDTDTSLLVQPKLAVTKDATITFDARETKPVEVTAPESAKMAAGYLNYRLGVPNGLNATLFLGESFKGLRTATLGPSPDAGKFSTQIGGLWQKGSTTYNLLYNLPDRFPTGYRRTAQASELALLKRHIGSSAPDRKGVLNALWRGPELSLGATSAPFALPATAKTYVTTPEGFPWTVGVSQQGPAADDDTDVFYPEEQPTSYRPGRTYESTYNVGVFSPAVDKDHTARRSGDTLDMCVPSLADGGGHAGSSRVSEQHTTVTAGGKKLLDNDGDLCQTADGLPATSAPYTIHTDVTRPAEVAGVTSRLTADWSFTSAKPNGSETASLPLSTVRFHPELTTASTAKAGSRITVPLSLQGPAATHLKSLAVQVSYDEGATWTKRPVTTTGGKRSLDLTHPKDATSVSFKADLTDTDGNTYAVTILKAYLLS
ncbi:S8 family peptidase [Streptomyces sp. NPDC003442]